MKTQTKIMLAVSVSVVGYVAYRGMMAGGGAGGPLGIMRAGVDAITAKPGTRVIAPPPK